MEGQCAQCAKWQRRLDQFSGGPINGWLILGLLVTPVVLFIGIRWLGALFACMGTYYLLVRFLPANIIGLPRYVFRDEGDKFHTHLENPWDAPLASSDRAIANVQALLDERHRFFASNGQEGSDGHAHLVRGVVLKLRYGGWFRSCMVLDGKARSPIWRVSTWNGNGVTLRNTTSRIRFGPLGLTTVLDCMNAFVGNDLAGLVADALRAREVTSEHAQLRAQLDLLGTAIVEALLRIESARHTIGRSEHARILREHFEAALDATVDGVRLFGEDVVTRWRERAAARFSPEEIVAATTPDPPAATAPPKS